MCIVLYSVQCVLGCTDHVAAELVIQEVGGHVGRQQVEQNPSEKKTIINHLKPD